MTFIYSLSDPETGKIRYVGKANNLEYRLKRHLNDGRRCHRTSWIKSLQARGLKPVIGVLATVPVSQWQFWEREFIRVLRASGAVLVNSTDGGDGWSGGKHTEQTLRVIREKRRKNWVWSAESSAKLSASLAGRLVSEGTREKISVAQTGKKLSAEHREKLSVLKKGRAWTPARRAAHKNRSGVPWSVARRLAHAKNILSAP